MKTKHAILIVIFLSHILFGCELFTTFDLDPELPPITTTGENTFGAIVNGQVWEIRSTARARVQYLNQDFITISGTFRTKDLDQYLSISLKNEPIEAGDYVFDKVSYPHRELNWSDDEKEEFYEAEDPEVTFNGTLTILKLDEQKKIAAGTFEFQIHKVGFPTINIGNGRFDLTY